MPSVRRYGVIGMQNATLFLGLGVRRMQNATFFLSFFFGFGCEKLRIIGIFHFLVYIAQNREFSSLCFKICKSFFLLKNKRNEIWFFCLYHLCLD